MTQISKDDYIIQSLKDLHRVVEKVENRLDRIENRLDKMEVHFETKFDKIDERFNKIDEKFEKLEAKMDYKFEKVDESFDELQAEVKKIKNRDVSWSVKIISWVVFGLLAVNSFISFLIAKFVVSGLKIAEVAKDFV